MTVVASIPTDKFRAPGFARQVDKIVVHAMGEFIDTEPNDFFAPDYLRHIGLSAHAFVTPSGVVIETAQDNNITWHAKGVNAVSLGIEFLVPGVHTYATFLDALRDPWTNPKQFHAGVLHVASWAKVHDVSIENIVRHSDISPGRKKDPGPTFPWDEFIMRVREKVDELAAKA